MINWEDVHKDFTPELQKEWEEMGFDYEEVKEWISIGLQVNETDFANYLQEQGYTPELCLEHASIKELREEYNNNDKLGRILYLH